MWNGWKAALLRELYHSALDMISGGLTAEARDSRIAVHCAGGYRSSIAASILQQYGITNLTEMAGGLAAWEAAKLPIVSGA